MKLLKRVSSGVIAALGIFFSGILRVSAAPFPTTAVPPGTDVTLNKIAIWVDKIAQTLIYLGVTLAVIFIIWGGIGYMWAGGDSEKATKAKTRLWNGIIGALIVLGVGLIINTIQTLVTRGL